MGAPRCSPGAPPPRNAWVAALNVRKTRAFGPPGSRDAPGCRAASACWACPGVRSSRSSPGWNAGQIAPHPACVPGPAVCPGHDYRRSRAACSWHRRSPSGGRGPPAPHEGIDDLQQLGPGDGTAPELEIHGHVVEIAVEVARPAMYSGGIDGRWNSLEVRDEVAERLDPSRGRTGPDGDQHPGLPAGSPGYVRRRRGCGDRPFDEGQVVPDGHHRGGWRGLVEFGDLELAGEARSSSSQSEERQLAAVARCELPDGQLGPAERPSPVLGHHVSLNAIKGAGART